MKRALPWILLALVAIVAIRELFPKRVRIVLPPRIITVHDTVRHLDTAWVTRIRRQTDTVNLVERVTVTVAETLHVCPGAIGLTALEVGRRVGDSTLAHGFVLKSESAGMIRRRWQAQIWTAGPLRSLVLDSLPPRLSFYDPPPAGCGFFCKLKLLGIGGAGGFSACAVLR